MTSTGNADINRRKDTAISQFTREANFEIASALKFFVYNFIQAAPRFNQAACHNCEASTFFKGTGSTEDAPPNLQSMGIDTSGDAAIWRRIVVFPALGGATTSARCPKPSGIRRSIRRVAIGVAPVSSVIRRSG